MATEQEWLNEDNHKIILVDIAYHDGTSLNTKYFSDYPYVLKFGDSFTNILGNTVSNISYDDALFDISTIITKINIKIEKRKRSKNANDQNQIIR